MPERTEQATSSWEAYQECMVVVSRFLDAIRVRDDEVWFGDSVCLGSERSAWLRAPVEIAPDGVMRAVYEVRDLVGHLFASLQKAIEAGRQPDEKIEKVLVGSDEAKRLGARTNLLEQILAELQNIRQQAPFEHHPAVLLRMHQALQDRIGPGDAGIRVTVTTTYIA